MTAKEGRPRVLVIGDVMTDVVVRPDGPMVQGADRAATIRLRPGGSAANQAAWLAAARAAPILVARVGRDDHRRHMETLRAAGIEPHLAADDTLPSGILVNIVAPDGERSFLTDRGANDRLCRADLPDALLDCVDFVHVSGYAFTNPAVRASVMDFLAAAARRGVPAGVDPGSLSLLREAGGAAFMSWTASARLCVPNSEEAAVLAGTADPARQLDILCRHYHTVVIKRGAEGAVAGTADGERCAVPAVAVAVAVDTTGAGDAFVAGFLSRWLGGAGLGDSVQAGCALGARATTAIGGWPAVAAQQDDPPAKSACKASGAMPS